VERVVLAFSATAFPLLVSRVSLFLIEVLHVRFERFLLPAGFRLFVGQEVRVIFLSSAVLELFWKTWGRAGTLPYCGRNSEQFLSPIWRE